MPVANAAIERPHEHPEISSGVRLRGFSPGRGPPTQPITLKLLRAVRGKSELIVDVPKSISLPRDPDDEIYLDLAVAANADYLVTWNEKHLTYVMQRDTQEDEEFCRRFPTLTILDPFQFLKLVARSA
jgi:predicted nucleic acid-binding protein